MRHLYVVLAVAATMLTVSCQPAVEPAAEQSAIKAVLSDYVRSVEGEDMDLYGKILAHDTAMVNFGTSGQPIGGWEGLKKVMVDQNAALSQTKIVVSNVSVIVPASGNLAWATSLWNFRSIIGQQPIELPVRCTWILEKREGAWVIVHFHKSVATS